MKEFDSIIGYDDIKVELSRIADMLNNPSKYKKLGVRLIRGLMIAGEEGLGKTLMANCLIKVLNRNVYTVTNDMGVSGIKETFNKAKENGNSIVFIDDLDNISNVVRFDNNAREYVTIQSCIDDCKNSDVFVLACVNNDSLVPRSLVREDRFDKLIYIETPNIDDATKIIEHFLSDKKCSMDLDYYEIASMLGGKTCSALKLILNEAGVYAGYENRCEIEMKDIIKSIMRLVYCSSDKRIDDIEEVAYHEAGHVVVSEVLKRNSVVFVTTRSCFNEKGGHVEFRKQDCLENKVLSLLGGRAAIEIVYGKDDIFSDYEISDAASLVKRFIDTHCSYDFICFGDKKSNELLKRKEVEVKLELERYYRRAKEILMDNRELLDLVANELIEKEVLLSGDIRRMVSECGSK